MSLWKDIVAEECDEALDQGTNQPNEEQPQQLDPKLMYDIQVLISRPVAKASQLLGN